MSSFLCFSVDSGTRLVLLLRWMAGGHATHADPSNGAFWLVLRCETRPRRRRPHLAPAGTYVSVVNGSSDAAEIHMGETMFSYWSRYSSNRPPAVSEFGTCKRRLPCAHAVAWHLLLTRRLHPRAPCLAFLMQPASGGGSYETYSVGNSSVCITATGSGFIDRPGYWVAIPKWVTANYTGLVNVTFRMQEGSFGSCSPDATYMAMYTGVFNRTDNVCSAASAAMLSGPIALLALAAAAWRLSSSRDE